MVVLVEYSPSSCLTLKRKGEEEPGLFLCPSGGRGGGDEDGYSLACCANKIRRLERAPAGDDMAMGEAAPPMVAPREVVCDMAAAAADDDDDDDSRGVGLLGEWRVRPWATLRAGAEWIRDMLREADSRTVRQLLAGSQEDGTGMALVPWGAVPTLAPSTAAATVDGEEYSEGSTAMDVEEDGGHMAQTVASAGAGCGDGEGYLCRWPQHVVAPVPAVGQASPAMWSW